MRKQTGIGTLISFSTQPGNVALDGAGRNSPFAGALVRHMGSSDDDLSVILISVRNDVMKETQRKQVPWEHSALTGRFYFGEPQVTPQAPSSLQDAQSLDAERAWSAIRDTSSVGMLETFITRYKGTFYAELAEVRLRELKAKPVATQPNLGSRGSLAEVHPFDGRWEARMTGGHACPAKAGRYTFAIVGNVVERWGGSIDANGELTFVTPAIVDRNVKLQHV